MSEQTEYQIVQVDAASVDLVKPLWGELLVHHQEAAVQLAGLGEPLTLDQSWPIRRAQYLDWFARRAGRMFAATLDGAPMAYCYVRMGEPSPTWNWGDGAGVLETLFVSRHARSNGLGSQLADLAFEHFRQAHVRLVTVSVVAGNERAVQLYRRFGGIDLLQTLAMPVQTNRCPAAESPRGEGPCQ